MFEIKIKPKQIYFDATKPKANSLLVCVEELIPNEKAQFSVQFRNNEYGTLDQVILNLEGQEYQSWVDDNYLINWIVSKLGVEKE
jgi:hypothetical protein